MTLGRSLLDSRVTQPDRAREIERPLFTQLNTATPVMPFVQHSGLDRRRKYPAPPSPYGHLPRSTSMPAVSGLAPDTPKPLRTSLSIASDRRPSPVVPQPQRVSPNGTRTPQTGEVLHIKPGDRAFYKDHRDIVREVWQPQDGDGTPDADKDDCWRFFQGPQSAASGLIPKYVCLDDLAAHEILNSSLYSPAERAKFWARDFSAPQGKILIDRANRGRPATSWDSGNRQSVPIVTLTSTSLGRTIPYTFRGESGGFGRWVFDSHPGYDKLIGLDKRTSTRLTMQRNRSARKATLSKVISLNRSNTRAGADAWTPLRGMLSHESKKTMDRKMRYQQAYPQRQPHKRLSPQVFSPPARLIPAAGPCQQLLHSQAIKAAVASMESEALPASPCPAARSANFVPVYDHIESQRDVSHTSAHGSVSSQQGCA